MRRNADDITAALHAGERWRADLRSASGKVRLETVEGEQLLHLENSRGGASYRFSTNAVYRRVGPGQWSQLLANVQSSAMEPDPRQNVKAWRWELELKPRLRGAAKAGRIRPLFTFLAVPAQAPTQ